MHDRGGVDFVALDVETANESPASICQIGMIRFERGEIVDRFTTLINPDSYFSMWATSIHGLSEINCSGSPVFSAVYSDIRQFAGTSILLAHSHFDRNALRRACFRYDLEELPNEWLDSCRLARRAWPNLKSYGLKSVCAHIGHRLDKHHCAEADAIAAGQVALACYREAGPEIFQPAPPLPRKLRSRDPSLPNYNEQIRQEGNPEGPFSGETISFTGTLDITRNEAARIAAELGFTVAEPMSRKTTVLVVGDQDVLAYRGAKVSSKMKKAEEMAAKGLPIRVIAASEFFEMASG